MIQRAEKCTKSLWSIFNYLANSANIRQFAGEKQTNVMLDQVKICNFMSRLAHVIIIFNILVVA